MPYYDYICPQCGRKFVHFFRYVEYGSQVPACPSCGAKETRRKIGKVRVARSMSSRLEELDSAGIPDSIDALEDNPQALGKMMRTMSKQLDEEMNPEFNEIIDRLEKGQKPDEIEKEYPQLSSIDVGDAID